MTLRKYLALLLILVVLAPRLSKLNSFVTIDEPFWLSVGANYYYALGQREFQNTSYEYHPAVTTMWLVTGAFLIDFPEFRGFGQGYFDVDKEKFDPFIIAHGHDPMRLLYLARLLQVAAIAVVALLIFYLLALLIGDEYAFLVTAFTASAPFFLGHSRVLSHEAMVAFFVLASILAMMVYLDDERKWYFLSISAAAAALAQLTKSSAMAMFPVIGLMLLISTLTKSSPERGLPQSGTAPSGSATPWFRLVANLKLFALWSAQLCIVYVIVWPGMWVAPGKMLSNVYGNAFSYAFQGARLEVTQQVEPASFNLAGTVGEMRAFANNLLWRGTPLAWAGVLLALIFLLARNDEQLAVFRKLVLYLFTAAVMFIVLFSLAHGRNSSHYIMTSHVCLDAIAALGWCALLKWLGMRSKAATLPTVRAGIVGLLVILQLISGWMYYPYYFNYSNPIMSAINGAEQLSEYGEGFEQAAAYLAQKPNAAELTVFSFRGRGPFSYFFPGRTILINPLFAEEPHMASMIERLKQSDYLVLDDSFGGRTPRTSLFVAAIDGLAPEHVILIKGVVPIRIYRVADLTASFYETISK